MDLALYRLEKAKNSLNAAEILYNSNSLLSANNRAYYAIFHALRSVLAIEGKDFKRHKDVLGYFNQKYIKTEVFPRIISKKIGNASKTREDSDYDDDYVPSSENTYTQIETAREVIELVEKYIRNI